ncbi:heterokaryon incompatibility protein-domain-containing protein [Lophiotrema nucula]|uniref:Heterokaryon incompatibility protein-domain-containing protein n=1 Tax=Lophiotrema nucula TaxID=690887 RepID=A0A6A5Z1M4_9PLEO|nr:heterokaryon incompatibility protein-domain-containing protein [Lophiotrema nucula]
MEKDEERLLALAGDKSKAYRHDSKRTFRPATVEGTPDVVYAIDTEDQKALLDFIALRKGSAYKIDERSTFGPYTPLRTGEIRILELYADNVNNSLKGELHVVSVEFEYPEKGNGWKRYTNHAVSIEAEKLMYYTALSYVWGPPLFDARFYLRGGHEIQITRGLEGALKHLRREDESVYLWVDQICINQPDSKEKEQQIPLMGSIYSHATNTLIWLGDDEHGTAQSAFSTLDTIHSRLDLCENQIGPADFEHLHIPSPTANEWHDIKRLFHRPWFFRLWTIQELMLSLNTYAKYGDAVAAWPDFAAWCSVLEYTGIQRWLESDNKSLRHSELDLTTHFTLGCGIVNELEKERYYLASFIHKSSILSVLVATRHAQASEPKDKVYGILGIASHHITPSYAPDVSVRQVYTEACIDAASEMFSLLSCVDHDAPLRPSWVPDWSSPRVTESLGYATKSHNLYCAGLIKKFVENGEATHISPSPGHAWFRLDNNLNTMTLRGKLVDTMASVGPAAALTSLDIDIPEENNSILVAYANIANQYQTYPTGEAIYDAFWKTLVANKDASGNSHAPQDYSEVLSLVLDSSTGKQPSLLGQTYSPRRTKGFFTLSTLQSRKPALTLDDLRRAFRAAAQNRCFAVTGKNYFGLVPRGTRVGDRIFILNGGPVPFVVREAEGGFVLVGECYIHGIMRGELIDQRMDWKEVTLV